MLTNQISQAAVIVKHGGVIAYSTDTILGLGCDPNNRTAIEKILWLKQRSIDEGLILLVDEIDALAQYSQKLDHSQRSTISSHCAESPTTWLVPAHASVPPWIMGKHSRVAIRITQHPNANELCKQAGAIVSTSANYSKFNPVSNGDGLWNWFGPHLDFVLIDLPGSGLPSEVRDLISGEILRKGTH